MAPGRGRDRVEEAPTTAESEPEREESHGGAVRLRFSDELTWRPGRPIVTGVLLERLDKLFKELVDMDQEEADKDSLIGVAEALGHRNLIAHKDAGVKAKTACCLVEILRICAPNAPFTEEQLKMIFSLFIKVALPGLQDPTHSYYREYKHVLTSLNEVKSILLLNDMEGADDLIFRLFSCCFDTVSTAPGSATEEQIPKDVMYNMNGILIVLIDEGPSIPTAVMDVIMAQFLRAAPPGGKVERGDQDTSQSTLLPKTEPEAYLMAKAICDTCPEKMSRYVSHYFSDVIMDSSQGFVSKPNGHKDDEDDEDEDHHGVPSESDLRELRKAHLLIRELWRASPLVLQNVVPQVDAELAADNVHLRQIAAETLGDMISGIGAAGPPPPAVMDPAMYPPMRLSDELPSHGAQSVLTTPLSPQSFMQHHPTAYHNFVGRKNDKVAAIRAAWTTAVGYILSTSAGGIGLTQEELSDLVSALGEKLNDNDEKVRLAAVKAIELFSFRDVVSKLGPSGGVDKEGSVLCSLADRCRDKRPAVRVDAMALLGKLWAVAAGELAVGQEAVVASLSAIPSRILNSFYANDLELNVLLDRVIFEYLVPLNYPPPKAKGPKQNSQGQSSADTPFDQDRIRAERILLLVKSLDQTARRAFFAIQSRQPQFAKILDGFVKLCESYNGGVMDENEQATTATLEKTIQYIAQFLPDDGRTISDLKKFAKVNDRRNYHLIKYIVNSDNDFKSVHRGIKEVIKRIQSSSSATILETIIPLIYRSACLMFNRSHLSTILDYSKSDKDGLGGVAHEILNEISQRIPQVFKTHVGGLCKDLMEQAPSDKKENDPAVVDSLKACSSYAKKYPDDIPEDKAFTQTLVSYAMYGRPPKAAKHAVSILLAKNKTDAQSSALVTVTNLLSRIMKDCTYGTPSFLTRLSSISQLELLAPRVTIDYDKEILELTTKKLLTQVRREAKDTDPGWVEDADMDDELQAKLLALKIHVNRLRSIDDDETATDRAKPVFKLLRGLIKKGGEMCKERDTPKHHKSRLRLRAGQLILKLCTIRQFDELLSHDAFNDLAYLTQDSETGVRKGFVEKLQKYLARDKLKPRFYTIVFLTAFEPTADLKQRCETWIRSRVHAFQLQKKQVMEPIMGRLISLLAHHPDYSPDLDDLVDHAKYILYFVGNVATEANLGLIFKYAERVKQTVDGINPEASENLHVISDLAQAVIRKWQEKKNWSFQAYPGKVGLPKGLYSHLQSHEEAQAIAEKQFIPDGIEERLDELLRAVDRKKKRKSMDDKAEPHPPAKKVRVAAAKAETRDKLKAKPKPKTAPQPKKAGMKTKTPTKPRKQSKLSSLASSGERRRSVRNKSSAKYAERDSSDDDKEMWEGVAEWEYLSHASDTRSAKDAGSDSGSDFEARAEHERTAGDVQEDNAGEIVEEPAVTEGKEGGGAEAPPSPKPKANGRKSVSLPPKRGRAAPKPKAKAITTVVKEKTASPSKAKAITPVRAAGGAKSKTRAKAASKDVYDMDLDDDE